MEAIDLVLLCISVVIALVARSRMKFFVRRKMGASNDALLEIDYWRVSSGEALTRSLVFVELGAWASTLVLVAILAASAIGSA
jgi:hypothetical protein